MLHRVKGKLPGNIDLIIQALAEKRNGYIHDTLLGLFEEYQSTTICIRLLGIDTVGSLPLILRHGRISYDMYSFSLWIPSTSSSC